MSDKVAKLEAELALAKLQEPLEEARATMHEDRSEENIAAYNEKAVEYANARAAFREAFPRDVPQAGSGEGLATVETIGVGTEVHEGE